MVGTETSFETAIREFTEETSIKPSTDERDYVYHGLIKQRKGKSVHVYSKNGLAKNLETIVIPIHLNGLMEKDIQRLWNING